MNYLTGGAMLERALVFKRRGGPLTLVHGGMERDNAAATGLALVDRDAVYNQMEYLQRHDGDRLAAQVDYLCDVIRDSNWPGGSASMACLTPVRPWPCSTRCRTRVDGSELVGEFGDTLFSLARETKDNWEIAQMREAGRLTGIVVGEVQEFIQSHDARRPGGQA